MLILSWLALRSAAWYDNARNIVMSVRRVRVHEDTPMAEWGAEEGERYDCKVVTITHHGKPRAEVCYDPSDTLEAMRIFPEVNSPGKPKWVFIPFGADKVPVGAFPQFD